MITYPLTKLGWLPLLYFKLLIWGLFYPPHSCLFEIASLYPTLLSVVSLLTLLLHHCLDRFKRETSPLEGRAEKQERECLSRIKNVEKTQERVC